MDMCKAEGALVRSVNYAGQRPVPIPIKGAGVTYYETDLITLECLGKPSFPANLLRRCKTNSDFLRVAVVREDELLTAKPREPFGVIGGAEAPSAAAAGAAGAGAEPAEGDAAAPKAA